MFQKILEKILFVASILLAAHLVKYRNNYDGEQKRQIQFSFRAAVLEHVPQGHRKWNTFDEIIDRNLKIYSKAIEMAHGEGVQLLVLPEDGLINSEDYNRSMLINFILEEIPDPRHGEIVNFCQMENKKRNSVLKTISCLAFKFHMFIALGFGDKVRCDQNVDHDCPDDGFYLYNTIVLFNWNGDLVAKYHKMQLYYEFQYNIPRCKEPVVYYDSPFGLLGFMLCFDLMFKLPGIKLVDEYRVQTIIYSTYWFNLLPFVGSVQMQQAFSISHDVNFLAASTQIPKTGTLGSGIYSGRRGALIYTNIPDGKSKLLIATVPTDPKSKIVPVVLPKLLNVFENVSKQVLRNRHMDSSDLQAMIILDLKQNSSANWCCQLTQFCCRVYYELRNQKETTTRSSTFALLAGSSISGALGQPRYPIYQEFCGMVLCETQNCSTFGSKTEVEFRYIFLSAIFNSRYVYPSVMSNYQQLLPTNQWTFNRLGPSENIISVKSKEQIVAITLYGRYYDFDPEYYH